MKASRIGRVLATCWTAGALLTIAASACDDTASTAAEDAAASDAAPSDAAPVEDAAGDGAASCALPATYGSLECNDCMRAQCCDPITTCEADPDCKVLAKCITDCLPVPDAGGCRNACLDTYPTSRATWDALEGCWFGPASVKGCLTQCT